MGNTDVMNVEDRKMQNTEVKNRDHNYSEVKEDGSYCYRQGNVGNVGNVGLIQKSKNIVVTNKEAIGGPIKDINELKKITPRVKLLAHDASSLSELTKINKTLKTKPVGQSKTLISEQMRQELRKYCRTCAGLKLPLVDIFSEKGIQMRLSQQMKHLEDINEYDSLSTQMCMDCICDLKMSYKFFMQIKKAEVKLKSIHFSMADAANRNLEKNDKVEANRNESLCLQNSSQLPIILDEPETQVSPDKPENIETNDPQMSLIQMLEGDLEDTESKTVEKTSKIEEQPLTAQENNPEIFEESQTFQVQSDNESIEEFDPDDPPFHPDSSEAAESDEEIEENVHSQTTRKRQTQTQTQTQKKENSAKQQTVLYSVHNNDFLQDNSKQELNQTVYKYDMDLKAYIKVDSIENQNIGQLIVPKVEALETVESRDHMKQPNILKRKLSLPTRKEATESNEIILANPTDDPKDYKMPRLNLSNPLGITDNSQEDGIMYVTVKGSKPNEILLVKVKKMDKPLEKKEDKNSSKKSLESKPIDKVLKRYDSFSIKDKDKPEKEQIIEEQIEQYKKKREKVLGNQGSLPLAYKIGEPSTRFPKRTEFVNSQKISESSNLTTKTESDKDENESSTAFAGEESDSLLDATDEKSEDKPCSTEEHISRLSRLKQKWEEAKKKKETLKQELDQSCAEGNIEKLTRILGEREKNLQEFQDYLKQRKIVITRLKDEDIISLYEDRNNANMKKNLPDLIDDSQPVDYIPEENYLECDYCIWTFSSKEILEEHLKTHDYKIMHYCEDCNEEFPTNKAKRNHNVVCIKKLLCKYCDLMLDSKGKKRQHEQKHCDSMYGQLCDVCGEKFKHQGTLDQHVKTQHMNWEKIYQCPKCPKKFAFKQKLSFHLKSVHTTMRAYLCEDCGADFKNPASLRHHRIRKHQPVGNKRECPVCHKLVPFYSLSKHMHTHKAYTIQCPHCDKMFKNSSTLKQHVRIHEDQRQYRCDTCGVGFNRRDGLRLHMRVHEKTDSRGLKECSCQVCGEKFPNHSTLVIHRNRVHKDGRQYTCHICNRSMISTRSLEWHMSHIHNESLPGIVKEDVDGQPERKRVSCYHCNKTFKTEMILRTHIKNTHMEKDPMKCLDCELTFTSEVRLRHHMMVTHNRLEGTLACPHCPKRFVNQLRLKTHMISHSEERPYTCEICGFNLKTKIQLIKHHQNRHSDERPLQCRFCPWRCKQVSALVCHERTHTNERPYSCSVCRQRFKYLGDKNKHERRHESLGGSGFKRIVPGRNIKLPKNREEETSGSEQEHEIRNIQTQIGEDEGTYEEQTEEQYVEKFEETEGIVKFEGEEIAEEYEQVYEQEYEETSREASDAAEVIMNMEDTTVYTEEVTADNIETAEIMTDEIITNEILQSGTVVHLQQQDDTGKIQVIPVMLSLPDLSDASAEVNLATASIMYNN